MLYKYRPFIIALIIFSACLYFINPYFQYYIDPDATAYFTIAKRYASGDISAAINGYWGPLACWLSAALIKCNLQAMPAAVIVNAVAAAGVLYISQSFFLFFDLQRKLQWALNAALAAFMLYAIFWQLFDDLWQCFLLLAILRIMLKEQFASKPVLWALTGILASVAYYAKAYSFSFFILSILCCTYFIAKDSDGKTNRNLFIRICLISIGAMIICCAPWLFALHQKYGIWTSSTAVSLNSSWCLVGHPYWAENIKYLLPPVYNNSVSYWEDPYWVNGLAPHFWNSIQLFFMQIVRSIYMLLRLMNSMNEISVFFIPCWIFALAVVVSKKIRNYFPVKLFIPALSFLLFPIGLVFINSESRYIWYMLPLSMIFGALLLQQFLLFSDKRLLNNIVIFIFCFSYLLTPILNMKAMFKEGTEEYKIANSLRELNISGSFTSNAEYGLQGQRVQRIAYFSNNPYYSIPTPDFLSSELLKEMRRYHVNYYFYFYQPIDYDGYVLKDEHGMAFPELGAGKFSGLKIFKLN